MLEACFYGLRLDLAVTAYALSPLFLFALWKDLPSDTGKHTSRYLYFISVFFTLVLSGNVAIYHFWRSLLNYRALTYLKDPAEVLASVSVSQAVSIILAFVFICFLTVWCCKKWIKIKYAATSGWKTDRFIFMSVWLVLTVTSVRGGVQRLPVNETHAFFSNDPFLNHTALNPVWHLAYDVKMAGITRTNPFKKLDELELKSRLSQLRTQHGETTALLDSQRPNIVLILLESFTADVVQSMNGDTSLTPTLDSLIQNGVLFNQIYSSGFRTDQGVVSVLNGWPATPYHSVMRSTDKCQRLPSLVGLLEKNGYASSFYYGGSAGFSNMGAYLQLQGFDRIITQDSFSLEGPRGRWGYHDETVLDRQLDDFNDQSQPFFSVLLTLSNHEPFDVPGPVHIRGDDEPSRFRNAVHYTDDALKRYFQKASRQDWFKNTLFILVADHAHTLPRKRDILFPNGRHIPMVFAGAVVKDSLHGHMIGKLGGHHDLPVTLLNQLKIENSVFSWSKDLCGTMTQSFAYLPIEDLLVWKTENGWFLYEYQRDSISVRSLFYDRKDEKNSLMKAKAFMQAHYENYLDL
ncbi:MAG: LTA synthase family protein [Bacteroidota bacterium]